MPCPHENVAHCPLYVAAHDPDLADLSCAAKGWGPEGGVFCAHVAEHAAAVERLRARAPRLVAECEWKEEADSIRAQRRRNMRAAGLS